MRDVLESAVKSHRYALSIDPENADTLFNTAQVLVTVAEELSQEDDHPDDTLQLLEEALEMQQKCLIIQETQFEEHRREQEAMMRSQTDEEIPPAAEEVTTSVTPSTRSDEAENQWFSVVEAVTPQTLIDAILAIFATLTTLTTVLINASPTPPTPTLAWINSVGQVLFPKLESLSSGLLRQARLDQDATETLPQQQIESILTQLKLLSTLEEASFRQSLSKIEAYSAKLSQIFTLIPTAQPDQSIISHTYLTAQAEALVAFAAAAADADNNPQGPSQTTPQSTPPNAPHRYNGLLAAVKLLAQAAKLTQTTPQHRAEAFFQAGSASLTAHALSLPRNGAYAPAANSAAQLLANADVYFRNAAKLQLVNPPTSVFAAVDASDHGAEARKEAAAEAAFRCTVVQMLQGKTPDLGQLAEQVDLGGKSKEWVAQMLEEMREGGMVQVEGIQFGV